MRASPRSCRAGAGWSATSRPCSKPARRCRATTDRHRPPVWRIRDMQGKLTDADGQTVEASLDAVRERLSGEAFFWLDLEGLDADSSELLLRGFAFHPLAVEGAEHFGQRPKVEDFDGFTYLVLHGALASLDLAAAVGLLYLFRRRGWLGGPTRSEEHTSELQSRQYLVCRLLL